MSLHVAIAIVGFRNAEDILGCLTALEGSTYTDFEVVICENGGPGAHVALQAVLPTELKGGQPVRAFLAPGNLGYAGGVNFCLEKTPDADAWWVLNPDTSPYPQALAAQVRRLCAGDCEAVGCTLHLPNGKVQSYGGHWRPWLGRAISIGHGQSLDVRPKRATIEKRQNYLNGASMLIGRRFLEVVGPMREDYFLYAEEVEWCLRGVALGMRLGFEPEAMVLHFQGTTTGNSPDMAKKSRSSTYLNERNKILLTRDRFPRRLPVVAGAAFLNLFLRYPRRGAWRQLGYALSGWFAGLKNERGAPDWVPV